MFFFVRSLFSGLEIPDPTSELLEWLDHLRNHDPPFKFNWTTFVRARGGRHFQRFVEVEQALEGTEPEEFNEILGFVLSTPDEMRTCAFRQFKKSNLNTKMQAWLSILIWFLFVLPLAMLGLTFLSLVNIGDQTWDAITEGHDGICYSGTGENKKEIPCPEMITTATYIKAGTPLWVSIALTVLLYKNTGP